MIVVVIDYLCTVLALNTRLCTHIRFRVQKSLLIFSSELLVHGRS